jgi:hypothetical protein
VMVFPDAEPAIFVTRWKPWVNAFCRQRIKRWAFC